MTVICIASLRTKWMAEVSKGESDDHMLRTNRLVVMATMVR